MRIVLAIVFAMASCTCVAQTVQIVKGKKKVPFPNTKLGRAQIGVMTDNDTIQYVKGSEKGWEVYSAGVDSFIIRKPILIIDSLVPRTAESYPEGFEYGKRLKINGVKYTRIYKVISYDYRSFAYKDIRRLKYPTYTGTSSGCMGCILVPGYNVYFIIWALHRWDAKEIDMRDWKIVVSQ